MIKIDLFNAERVVAFEAERNMVLIHNRENEREAKIRIEQIRNKIRHTYEVMQDGSLALDVLKFNDSTRDFALLALLNHDIGRFLQMQLAGTYKDYEAKEIIGVANHGILGRILLLGQLDQYNLGQSSHSLIEEQIPNGKSFYNPIAQIVEDHVTSVATDEALKILTTNLFKDYSMEEILKFSDEYYKDALSAITQLVQDVDRLDIYHQILSGRWTPDKVEEPIHPIIVDKFYNGEYLNINSLKAQGLWNDNAGELVRLSFINQIRLLSVAQIIYDENLIIKLKEKRNNKYAEEAFDYTQKLLEEMITTSKDGITVGKVKKL